MNSPEAPVHFPIVIGHTRSGFKNLQCLLCRIWSDGTFELISPGWEILGYRPHELRARCFCELIPLDPDFAYGTANALLCRDGRRIEFQLRHKDGRLLTFRWHRHRDDYTDSTFVVGVVGQQIGGGEQEDEGAPRYGGSEEKGGCDRKRDWSG